MLGAPLHLLLLLGALCVRPARAGSHSLRYFYSSLSEERPGIPQFSIAGYVDDVAIEAYSSASRRLQPRAPWMGMVAALDPQYWKRETETARGSETALSVNVKTVMSRLNQTAVPPQTMISRKKTDTATTLSCYAYGFYPREIEVKWVRNLVEVDWKTKIILPNTDGTYQISCTVELPEGHNVKDYRCLVDHIGLEDIIAMVYEEKCGTPNIWILVGAIAAALVALGVTAAAIWKRKHAGKETYNSVKIAPDFFQRQTVSCTSSI